jgi:hypothetical protein
VQQRAALHLGEVAQQELPRGLQRLTQSLERQNLGVGGNMGTILESNKCTTDSSAPAACSSVASSCCGLQRATAVHFASARGVKKPQCQASCQLLNAVQERNTTADPPAAAAAACQQQRPAPWPPCAV